jgi:hypothetical protein
LRKLVCDREKYKSDMFEMSFGFLNAKTLSREDDGKSLLSTGLPLNKPTNISIDRSQKYMVCSQPSEFFHLTAFSASVSFQFFEELNFPCGDSENL